MSNIPAAFTMPFGKHKGLPMDVVPESYLVWLLGQDWPQDDLRAHAEGELARRAGVQQAAAAVAGGLPAVVGPELAQALVEAGRQALIERHGDDPALILALDATAELLETWALEVFKERDKDAGDD